MNEKHRVRRWIKQVLTGTFGVRHQSHNVPFAIANPGDIIREPFGFAASVSSPSLSQ
jgi:hypothetical protein